MEKKFYKAYGRDKINKYVHIISSFFFCIFYILCLTIVCGFQENAWADVDAAMREGVRFYNMGLLEKARISFEQVLKEEDGNTRARAYIKQIDGQLMETEWVEGSQETRENMSMKAPEMQSPTLDRLELAKQKNTFMSKVNNVTQPFYLSGEYRSNFGVERTDFTLQDCNPAYSERNWRILSGKELENTYDRNIFNRFRVNIDAEPQDEEGFGFHSNITVDPWSFPSRGKKTKIMGSGGSYLIIEPKYLASNGQMVDEIWYATSGDSVGLPEFGVKDGKTQPFTATSLWLEKFNIPSIDVEHQFVPIRELWVDYTTDKFYARAFAMGYEDQALTSDDPLTLSNRNISWLPSPWTYQWVPGIMTDKTTTAPQTFRSGQWSYDVPFMTKDGDYRRITALRGMKLEWMPAAWPFFGNSPDDYYSTIECTIATPKGLWEDYDHVNSIPGAIRQKHPLHEKLTVGSLYAFNYGLYNQRVDSSKHNMATDVLFTPFEGINLKGEVARSLAKENQNRSHSDYKIRERGWVYHGQAEGSWPEIVDPAKDKPLFSVKLMATHMDEGFVPALADFTYTRRDETWSRYIYMPNPHQKAHYIPETIMAQRIGDGIDRGRDTYSGQLNVHLFNQIDNLLYFRSVDNTDGHKVERQLRDEIKWDITSYFRMQSICFYQWMPKTRYIRDIISYKPDPFIDSWGDPTRFLENSVLTVDKDPSIGSFGAGFQLDVTKEVTGELVWVYTNDQTNYPRGLLNDVYQTRIVYEGQFYWAEIPYLYSQQWFKMPPYNYYNILRGKIYLHPFESLFVTLKGTFNDEKYAGGVDDNINNVGTDIEYHVTKKAKVSFFYTFSKCVDMARLVNTNGVDKSFDGHHNIAAEFTYRVRENGMLTLEYGERMRYYVNTYATGNPYTGFNATLDTAHIFRARYTEKF